MIENLKNEKSYLTFKEMMVEYEKRPTPRFLWNGIKEKSFGLVFGPSKSGKTIFGENLAISIAIGAKEFFDYDLSGIPKKVLFIGLEEDWGARAERNQKQYNSLNENQKELMNDNYLYQPIEFNKRIITDKDWNLLIETIVASEAEVVFIDSITRMNPGKLEDSKTGELITQRLRSICYELSITLICIHHTPKMYDSPITMDKIKGTSVFSQESDFAIGINRTSKEYRYLKNVFFRYAPDDDDTVKEFVIDNNLWLNVIKEEDEDQILNRSDRRRKEDKRESIVKFLDENITTTYPLNELVGILKSVLSIEDRMVKSYLSELVKSKRINNISYGNYASINYVITKTNEDGRV